MTRAKMSKIIIDKYRELKNINCGPEYKILVGKQLYKLYYVYTFVGIYSFLLR